MESSENRTQIGITRIGKYDVIDVLGRGGMGVVYRGFDKQFGSEVAIKTLTQSFMDDPDMLARFYDEARTTRKLKHPNIVTVYDMGVENNVPYIVMECVEGDSLEKLIRTKAPISLADRLQTVQEVCSALGYAHRNNVIHRDVKPANIFVQPDGTAKLLDFGIARLAKRAPDSQGRTKMGDIIGTPAYMAPERIRNGEEVDGRSDIFSAGVVLYQLVTGQLPFTGDDYVLMEKLTKEPYPPLRSLVPDCPASLELIIERSLAKLPADRYETADEMAVDLTAAIGDLRQEQVTDLYTEAKHYVEAEEFTRARGVLQLLLKIDSKHVEGRQLLSGVQRHFTQRQKEERVQHCCQQAEDALNQKHFDQALSILEEGLQFDTSNIKLSELREKAKREKEKQDRINEYLREAEACRRKRDYKSAIAAANKALKVDKENSKVIALCNLLTKEAEEAKSQAKARTLLDQARSEINARRYVEAIELLDEVDKLDSTNPELQLLRADAKAGQEQIKRREVITRLEEEVGVAISLEQLQQAAKSIQAAMQEMPAEAALFRLSAQVDRQLRDHDNRRLVDETVQAVRNLGSREALELVKKARQRVPGDERLLSLEALLNERYRQQSLEERRAEFLSRARVALNNGQFSEAVKILESCQQEGIATNETLSLLDFARHEESEHKQQDILRSNLDHAQALIADSAFDEAISFLETLLQQTDDTAMRLLLEQGLAGREALRHQVDAEMASAAKLVQEGKPTEAVEFIEKLPAPVLRSLRAQAALAALREELQQAMFRMAGRAYAVLESDLPAGNEVIQRVAAASGRSAFASTLAESFQSRARTLADRIVTGVITQSQTMLRNREKEAAGELLIGAAPMVQFASPQVKTEWQRTQRKSDKGGGLFSRS
jgi:serine/threonine-protein kinase